MQRFLRTRQVVREENIPVLHLLLFLRGILLSAVCQIPRGWKQADNCSTTTTLQGRPYTKPYYDEGNPSTIIDQKYTSRV